ncbi:hypothetical protein TWF694_008104 [Orbilia ellipsospora]|uniref:CorA-like transporter domain-containing protein n=1 Tax=Orbilia ellipsospora TaxID=2528407 RepID=A0AAV9XF42_9PEZI
MTGVKLRFLKSEEKLSVYLENGIAQLLEKFDAPPEFADLLNVFGVRDKNRDEGFGCFWSGELKRCNSTGLASTGPPSTEQLQPSCFYLLKHPELHGRARSKMPWTIRQVGVYQRAQSASSSNLCLFIEPSKGIRDRLETLFEDSNSEEPTSILDQHWSSPHSLALSAFRDNWRAYTNYWENTVTALAVDALFPELEAFNEDEDFAQSKLLFERIQDCQAAGDSLLRARHAIEINLNVLNKLSAFVQEVKRYDINVATGNQNAYSPCEAYLRECISEQEFTLATITMMFKRTKRVIVTIREMANFRELHALRRLGKLSRNEAEETSKLTQQTIRETQIMKSITILALLFLPASFVAAFLAMDYISVVKLSSGFMRISVKPEMLLYLAITIPLTTVTMGGWLLWESRKSVRRLFRQRPAEQDPEKGGRGP